MPQRIRRSQNVAEWKQLDGELTREKDDVLAAARESKAAYDAIAPSLCEVLKLLKAERQTQGLSLAEMESRSGLAKSKPSHLEYDPESNPTLSALRRYAMALGRNPRCVWLIKPRWCDRAFCFQDLHAERKRNIHRTVTAPNDHRAVATGWSALTSLPCACRHPTG